MSINLLALPCAGASATMYMRWRKNIVSTAKLLPVELPGRGMRMEEPYIKNYNEMIHRLCYEQSHHMRQEYVLFGHSMGALLAYGMTIWQRQHNKPMPKALIVSASSAPSKRDIDRFANKDNDEALIQDLITQGGTPRAVFDNAELLRMTLNTLSADYRICQSFIYSPLVSALNVPLFVLAGRRDDIEIEGVEAWRKEAENQFAIDWFDGDHFFIWKQEKEVLSCINQILTTI